MNDQSLIAVLAVEVLVVCAGLGIIIGISGKFNDRGDNPITAQSKPDTDNSLAQLKAQYNKILDEAPQRPFDSSSDPSEDRLGDIEYALQHMNADDIPEVLLRKKTSDVEPIIFSAVDPQGSEPIDGDVRAMDGVASAGGTRARIQESSAGDEVFMEQTQSPSPEISGHKFTFDGKKFHKHEDAYAVTNGTPDKEVSSKQIELNWTKRSDRKPIEQLTSGTSEADEKPKPQADSGSHIDPSIVPSPDKPKEQENTDNQQGTDKQGRPSSRQNPDGTVTASGTVRVLGAEELADLMGLPGTPNGETDADRFAIFQLDTPMEITGKSSGSAGQPLTKNVSMVAIGNSSTPVGQYEHLEGQHVTATFTPGWWPSDASMPLETLHVENFQAS